MTDSVSAPQAQPEEGAATTERAGRKGIDWAIVKLALACFGLQVATFVTVAVSPFIMGSILEVRQYVPGEALSDFQTGQIRTMEILAYALLCIALGARIRLFEPRALGLIGLVVMVVANGAAMFGTNAWELIFWRMLHAAGGACAMSAAAALLVRALNPQRIGGSVTIPILAMGMGGVIFASQLDQQAHELAQPILSQVGAYGAVCAAAAVGFVLTWFFAPRGKTSADIQPAFSTMLGALKSPYTIAVGVVYFGSTAVWQSFRQIGLTHDLTPEQIGNTIVAAQVLGALFGACMTFLKPDWVRPAALLGFAVFGAVTIFQPLAPDATSFIASQFVLTATYICIVVLISTIGARLDRTGGLNAAGMGWQALVNATSPWFGGFIIDYLGGYHNLFVLSAVATAIALPMLYIATRNLPPVYAPPKA